MDEINKVTLSKIHNLIKDTLKDVPAPNEHNLSGFVRIDPSDLLYDDDVSKEDFERHKHKVFNAVVSLYPKLTKIVCREMLKDDLVFKDTLKQVETIHEIVILQMRDIMKRYGA